jgi:hypothetical protein
MQKLANTLAERQLKNRIEEQKRNGFVKFKNRIARTLVSQYFVSEEEAAHLVSRPDFHKDLTQDILWSQHMGSEYWADELYKRYIGRKMVVR